MIPRILVFILCFLIFLGGKASLLEAHVYLTSGTLEIFSHIDPDDDPIAGEESTFFLIFSDSSGKFDSSKCDCSATVKDSKGNSIYEKNLFEIPDPTTAEFKFALPQKDVYDLEIKGVPREEGAFVPFEVHRIFRVERSPVAEHEHGGHLIHIAIFAAGFAAVGFIFWGERKKVSKDKGSSRVAFLALASIISFAFFTHELHASLHFGCDSKHPCCATQAFDSAVSALRMNDSDEIASQETPTIPSLLDRLEIVSIKDKSPPFFSPF